MQQPSRQHCCLLLAVLKQSFLHPSVCMSLPMRPFPGTVILPDRRASHGGLIPACRREVCCSSQGNAFPMRRESCRWRPLLFPATRRSFHWETQEQIFTLRKSRPLAPFPAHHLLQGSRPLSSAWPTTGVSPSCFEHSNVEMGDEEQCWLLSPAGT